MRVSCPNCQRDGVHPRALESLQLNSKWICNDEYCSFKCFGCRYCAKCLERCHNDYIQHSRGGCKYFTIKEGKTITKFVYPFVSSDKRSRIREKVQQWRHFNEIHKDHMVFEALVVSRLPLPRDIKRLIVTKYINRTCEVYTFSLCKRRPFDPWLCLLFVVVVLYLSHLITTQ